MSNPKPDKTPEVVEATVVIDPNDPNVVPKPPNKFKTAVRHPIQTIKRHNIVSTALITAVVAVASTLFVVRKDNDNEEFMESTTDENSDDSDNVIPFDTSI